MLAKLDDVLNAVTMYRLVVYSLVWLVVVVLLLSIIGVLHYSPIVLISSLGLLSAVGFATNMGLSKIYRVTPNFESGIITTLILFFVLAVPTDTTQWLALALGAFIANASKYVITWRGAHIFNPAAMAAFIVSLTGIGFASWWIATPILLPFVSLVGILILRKTRRFSLFCSFFIPAFSLLLLQGNNPVALLLSFPLIFFATIMLTEPATSPNTNRWRIVYGVVIGLVVASGFGVFSSPQFALLIGNILAFVVSFRTTTSMQLVKKTQLAPNIYDFAFKPNRKITFLPGQYLDWTLGDVGFDSRGNRRTFTVASSPNQESIHIGVRKFETSSAFKQTLFNLEKGDTVIAGRASGDFVLPKDRNKKIVFVAGGIGITPFIAMLSHLILTNDKRDVTLFYFVNQKQDIVYSDVFKKAEKIGLKLVPMIGPEARLDKKSLMTHIPHYKQYDFYVSGPPAMVRLYKRSLKKLAVKNIHTDYFSGY